MHCKALVTTVLLAITRSSLGLTNGTATPQSQTQSNSTGFRIQHGFETVLVQPYGYDGFRVRAWPFRPPNGNEVSFLYDPPLEGPENGVSRGMKYDITANGSEPVVVRNGNTIVNTYSSTADNTTNVRLAFYRIENEVPRHSSQTSTLR